MARNPQKMNVAQKLETVNRCMGHTKRGLEDGRYTRGLIKMRCFTAEKLLDEWQESFTEEMEDRVAETRRKIKKYLKTVEQGYSPKVEYPQGMNVRDDIEKEDVEADIKNIYIGAAGSVFEKNSSRSSSCSSERNTSSGKRKREMYGSINDEDGIEMAAEQAKDGKKKPIRPDTQSQAERQSISIFDKMVEDSDDDEVDTTARGDDTLPYDMNREGWWMGEKENVLAELGEMIEMERRVRKDETARFKARQNEKENRLKEELEERDHQLSVLVKATISSRVESMEAETRKENNKLHEKLEMVQEKMERLEAQMAKMTSEQRMGTPAKTERRESIIPNTTILFEGEPEMFEGFIVRHESILARYGEVEEWEKFDCSLGLLYWPPGKPKSRGNIVEYLMTRHVFGAKDSPYVVSATLRKVLKASRLSREEREEITRSFYVDDLILASNDEDYLREVLGKVLKALDSYFTLTKLAMNSIEIRKTIPPERRIYDYPEKVLGIKYEGKEDKLYWIIQKKTLELKATWRDMLGAVASIYDPLGLINIVTSKLRLTFSQLSKGMSHWKEEIPEEKRRDWNTIVARLPRQLNIARYAGSSKGYHIYTDASDTMLGVAIYSYANGTEMIMRSKALMVRPAMKTMPRHELAAPLQGVRLALEVSKGVARRPALFMTDSEVVLRYIKNDEIPMEKYARTRVLEIRQYTDPDQWYHVKSENNPADWLTKIPVKFNQERYDKWAKREITMTQQGQPCKVLLLKKPANNEQDFAKFLSQREGKELTNVNDINLEVEKAICEAQMEIDPKRLAKYAITRGQDRMRIQLRRLGKKESYLENPRILDGKSTIGKLMVKRIHEENCHAPLARMRVILRETYWVLNEVATIRRVIAECDQCRRYRSIIRYEKRGNKPYSFQIENDLEIFKYIGIDHFGPFKLKQGGKLYVLLLICLQSKTVQLEVTEGLDTNSTKLALERAWARERRPSLIISDNYRTFKAMAQEKNQIDWQFTAPKAPYQGGVWEVAVKAAKYLAKPYLHNCWSHQKWQTLWSLVEKVINDKPLQQPLDDPDQILVTPNLLKKRQRELRWNESKWSQKSWNEIQRQWKRIYLQELVRQQWRTKGGRKLQVGDKVLVTDKQKARHRWVTGVLTEIIPSHDGAMRKCKLNTARGPLIRAAGELLFVGEEFRAISEKQNLIKSIYSIYNQLNNKKIMDLCDKL
ncbi:unnamed protein product [Dimorphilus gyrociliatus]|uniref:DUF5641 domain-containing protein n=1 Tax=Dimorphilus gyrociliatus TaxID=2664684 RepID=A0A7I8WE16_9ANNE|nr:unnamed protein product [Dimorphilus gyrociliatus]